MSATTVEFVNVHETPALRSMRLSNMHAFVGDCRAYPRLRTMHLEDAFGNNFGRVATGIGKHCPDFESLTIVGDGCAPVGDEVYKDIRRRLWRMLEDKRDPLGTGFWDACPLTLTSYIYPGHDPTVKLVLVR